VTVETGYRHVVRDFQPQTLTLERRADREVIYYHQTEGVRAGDARCRHDALQRDGGAILFLLVRADIVTVETGYRHVVRDFQPQTLTLERRADREVIVAHRRRASAGAHPR
jgi:hypothetical protein